MKTYEILQIVLSADLRRDINNLSRADSERRYPEYFAYVETSAFGSAAYARHMSSHYTVVGTVLADDPEEAFTLLNLWNDESRVERYLPMRSLSVGDILRDTEANTAYMVDGFGFEEVSL